jgi:hypothetical protein
MSGSDMPRALRVVAWLCIAQGCIAIANMAGGAGGPGHLVDVSIVMLLVGPGLFTRHAGWRTFALAMFVVYQLIALLAIAVGVLFAVEPAVGTRTAAIGVVLVACLLFGLAKWSGRVLQRADVRAWFAPPAGAS